MVINLHRAYSHVFLVLRPVLSYSVCCTCFVWKTPECLLWLQFRGARLDWPRSWTRWCRNQDSASFFALNSSESCTSPKILQISKVTDQKVLPCFVLFVDDANKSIVLAIRGTLNLDDVLRDAVSPVLWSPLAALCRLSIGWLKQLVCMALGQTIRVACSLWLSFFMS